MNILITYDEISDYIRNEFNFRPILTRIDKDAIIVSCKPGVLAPTVSMDLKIKAVRKDLICLSWDSSPVILMIMKVMMAFKRIKNHDAIDIFVQDKLINIYPQHLFQLGRVLEHVVLLDMMFEENVVDLQLDII